MTLLVAFIATAVIFLAIDMIGLRLMVLPIFNGEAPGLFLNQPNIAPAVIFYIGFVVGIVWFVTAPALASGGSLLSVALNGAALGAIAYGTYEFTNLATVKGWTLKMTVVDFTWGVALTAVSAAGGVWAARLLTGAGAEG